MNETAAGTQLSRLIVRVESVCGLIAAVVQRAYVIPHLPNEYNGFILEMTEGNTSLYNVARAIWFSSKKLTAVNDGVKVVNTLRLIR